MLTLLNVLMFIVPAFFLLLSTIIYVTENYQGKEKHFFLLFIFY